VASISNQSAINNQSAIDNQSAISNQPISKFQRTIMEVILREHVDNLGRRGEVVKVADGYARNYLLPRKLALLATEGNKKQIEREKVKFEAKEAEERGAAESIAQRMANVEIEISRKVGETEALYGSVTTADIAEALGARGFEIDRRKVQLHEPIKKLGEFDIPVKLHREVTTHVKVRVVAEGGEQKK
jgi:large subunit ribosomal protein L9